MINVLVWMILGNPKVVAEKMTVGIWYHCSRIVSLNIITVRYTV